MTLITAAAFDIAQGRLYGARHRKNANPGLASQLRADLSQGGLHVAGIFRPC